MPDEEGETACGNNVHTHGMIIQIANLCKLSMLRDHETCVDATKSFDQSVNGTVLVVTTSFRSSTAIISPMEASQRQKAR